MGPTRGTKPVVVLQLSWSAGDHIVSRAPLKTLNDLKREGKKVRIACQQGGPHVGLLYDALAAAQLTKNDVEVVFVPDLTGEKGPAELFRKDATIDACCVITPDMIGLTGGLDSAGTGAEGTVEGAHVLVSTQNMSRSIADVYAVRGDWYRANRAIVEKFVAGYLKASEEVIRLRDEFEKTKSLSAAYRSLLQMSQQIFGADVLPTLEVDAHGLLLDCRFVGLPGQIAFFEQTGNLNGFEAKTKSSLDLAVSWGYARSRNGFDPPGFDYKKLAELAGVPYVVPKTVTGEGAEGASCFSTTIWTPTRSSVSRSPSSPTRRNSRLTVTARSSTGAPVGQHVRRRGRRYPRAFRSHEDAGEPAPFGHGKRSDSADGPTGQLSVLPQDRKRGASSWM